MEKLIIKYNNGLGAILCSKCSVIIKTGKDFTEDEFNYIVGKIKDLPAQYCDKCKKEKL